MKKRFNITLRPETLKNLKRLSFQCGMSCSEFIENLTHEYEATIEERKKLLLTKTITKKATSCS